MLSAEEAGVPEQSKPKGIKSKRNKKETQKKILQAALEVFARYPYHAASIRMISNLAEVDHPMISYHFGSKANLFKAVLADVLDQRRQLQKKWYAETIPLGAARGLSRFIDYVLEDYRKGPGFFHIVSLNFFQTEDMDSIPGYELIQEFFNADADEMKDHLSLQVSDLEGDMFIRALSVMLVGFLGGTGSNAKILGMEPDSIVYYNWVRDTIIYALLPRFSKMVQNP